MSKTNQFEIFSSTWCVNWCTYYTVCYNICRALYYHYTSKNSLPISSVRVQDTSTDDVWYPVVSGSNCKLYARTLVCAYCLQLLTMWNVKSNLVIHIHYITYICRCPGCIVLCACKIHSCAQLTNQHTSIENLQPSTI